MVGKARLLSDDEARFLVDAYYMMQDDRKRYVMQTKSLEKDEEPNDVLEWLSNQATTLEKQIARALDAYTDAHEMGGWMRNIYGIGPVLSAGLLAHLDIEKCPTAGHIWAFAGWAGDGQKKWEKGKKKPFNGPFRTLCWKIGQSFMKFSNQDECYYGKLYRERKEYEIARNESGGNAERAARILEEKSFGKSTEAYKAYSVGKLPPAHIDAQARRWTVKLFLAHLHGEWYQRHFGKPAPLPYPIAHLNHAHVIEPPTVREPQEPSEPSEARVPPQRSEPSSRREPR